MSAQVTRVGVLGFRQVFGNVLIGGMAYAFRVTGKKVALKTAFSGWRSEKNAEICNAILSAIENAKKGAA